jgi:hypothetical protein
MTDFITLATTDPDNSEFTYAFEYCGPYSCPLWMLDDTSKFGLDNCIFINSLRASHTAKTHESRTNYAQIFVSARSVRRMRNSSVERTWTVVIVSGFASKAVCA